MNSNANIKHNLLLIDDEQLILTPLSIGLSRVGYVVSTAQSVDEAETMLDNGGTAGSGHP